VEAEAEEEADANAEAEAEAEVPEAPENMPLLLPLCFKGNVRILLDFC
jgi:hypothetical protein